MRNATLHAILKSFTAEAAVRLAEAVRGGAEIEFELVAAPGAGTPLYCYRPLTARFIDAQLDHLSELAGYGPAVRALDAMASVGDYVRAHGDPTHSGQARGRAQRALLAFLGRVFAERIHFAFEPEGFEAAYAELELALYEGRRTTTVIAPVLGLALEHGTRELVLGGGMSLLLGDAVPGAPYEAVHGDNHELNVLAMLTLTEEGLSRSALSVARARFGRLLTALRLFERGTFALGPLAWACADGGAWRPLPLGAGGRPRSVTFLSGAREDELRDFIALISRRLASRERHARGAADSAGARGSRVDGAVEWALARFEMGCDRGAPTQALTDYLLALRALLEPEGPDSGRLAGRLGALRGSARERLAITQRIAAAVAMERAVIWGLPPDQPADDTLVAEVAEHLRLLLVDAVCLHAEGDLYVRADELLLEAAEKAS